MSNTKTRKQEEKKEVIIKTVSDTWLNTIYSPDLLSIDELNSIYETVKYIGFDRNLVLTQLEELKEQPKFIVEVIITCALRGPKAAVNVKLSDSRTINQLKIAGSGQIKTKNLSCSRITAATADLAAYYLKALHVPKRMDIDLPAWLQFPAAGSIRLPERYRQSHKEFARRFSVLIGGEFNESIYLQMEQNSYLDDRLHLFE
jgi:hypothetical protein